MPMFETRLNASILAASSPSARRAARNPSTGWLERSSIEAWRGENRRHCRRAAQSPAEWLLSPRAGRPPQLARFLRKFVGLFGASLAGRREQEKRESAGHRAGAKATTASCFALQRQCFQERVGGRLDQRQCEISCANSLVGRSFGTSNGLTWLRQRALKASAQSRR